MEEKYFVYSGNDVVGKILVSRKGLYYCIRGVCQLTGAVKYELRLCCGNSCINLGLCVPVNGGFGMDTKIPCKQIPEGAWHFQLVPRHEAMNENFVPIRAEEPFAYIQQLHSSYLAQHNGALGICYSSMERDKPTGQWSEPSTSE